MEIVNTTRSTVITHSTEIADNAWTRLRGLIGHAPLQPGEGMLIRPCSGVHCWFMGFPIDVVFVDKDWRVVHVTHNMKPWAVGMPVKGAHFVIELPAGQAQATQTQPGDRLEGRSNGGPARESAGTAV